jgi:hypothetical protein
VEPHNFHIPVRAPTNLAAMAIQPNQDVDAAAIQIQRSTRGWWQRVNYKLELLGIQLENEIEQSHYRKNIRRRSKKPTEAQELKKIEMKSQGAEEHESILYHISCSRNKKLSLVSDELSFHVNHLLYNRSGSEEASCIEQIDAAEKLQEGVPVKTMMPPKISQQKLGVSSCFYAKDRFVTLFTV